MVPIQPSATAERRAVPRQPVTYRLDVVAEDGCAGYLLDVSVTGLRARFKQGLDLERTRGLRIEFPRWLELGKGVDLGGRFVWVRVSETGATEVGFAFDALSRKDRSVLEVLVQRLSEARIEDALPEE